MSVQRSTPSDGQDVSEGGLPPGYVTLQEVSTIANDRLSNGSSLISKEDFNVIGFARDFQPPIETRGSDWKCTIEMVDHSIFSPGIKFITMWSREKLPPSGAVKNRDAVVVRGVKAQFYGGAIQLLSKHATEIYIMSSANFATWKSIPPEKLWKSYPPNKRAYPKVTVAEYVASLDLDDLDLKSSLEFDTHVLQATKNNDKFGLLKDVQPRRYYDILGQVIRVFQSQNCLTVYVSDYTFHPKFYNHAFWGYTHDISEGRDSDPYGYIKSSKKDLEKWPGPFGKHTIQLSLFDEQEAAFKASVHDNNVQSAVGMWFRLGNVFIKFDSNAGDLLEGAMYRGRAQVYPVKMDTDEQRRAGLNNPQYLDALRRKRQYEEKFAKQQKELLKSTSEGEKRRSEEEQLPSKKRRKAKREAKRKEKLAGLAEKIRLNKLIESQHHDEPIVPFDEIMRPEVLASGEYSPFTVCKYKATVRVVDYWPPHIEDFTIGRRESEYDILSDYSGGEDTDQEADMRPWKSGKGVARKTWQWRFALQVADASCKDAKGRMWLMVDHEAAQCLLNDQQYDEAVNLRHDPNLVAVLKERLCILWGDLEERKSTSFSKPSSIPTPSLPTVPPASSLQSTSSSQPPVGAQPDIDSDEEGKKSLRPDIHPEPDGIAIENRLPLQRQSIVETAEQSISKPRNTDLQTIVTGHSSQNASATSPAILKDAVPTGQTEAPDTDLNPSNLPFTCCIKQYGIQVDEKDCEKADAGDGKRWQRMFALFGTIIKD